MRYFRAIGFSLVLFLVFTAFIFSQEKNQKKPEKKQLPVSLIRKDILALDVKKLDPPKRNIFIPNSAGGQEIESDGLVAILDAQRTHRAQVPVSDLLHRLRLESDVGVLLRREPVLGAKVIVPTLITGVDAVHPDFGRHEARVRMVGVEVEIDLEVIELTADRGEEMFD